MKVAASGSEVSRAVAAFDQTVVDAAVVDEEQDDGLVVLPGRDHRAAAAGAHCAAEAWLTIASGRRESGAAVRLALSVLTLAEEASLDSGFFAAAAATHRGHQEDAGDDQQHADHGDLGQRVFVELLPHTFAY